MIFIKLVYDRKHLWILSCIGLIKTDNFCMIGGGCAPSLKLWGIKHTAFFLKKKIEEYFIIVWNCVYYVLICLIAT